MLTTTSVILDTTAVNESRIDSSIECLDCAKVIKLKEVTNTGKNYKFLREIHYKLVITKILVN